MSGSLTSGTLNGVLTVNSNVKEEWYSFISIERNYTECKASVISPMSLSNRPRHSTRNISTERLE